MSVTTPHTDMELVHGIRAGDEQAREQLIMRHMPLVRSIAHRYAGRGLGARRHHPGRVSSAWSSPSTAISPSEACR